MAKQLEEIKAIDENPEAATFENTIVAMEKSGQDLMRARKIFDNLTASATNDSLQAIKADLAPKLAAHSDAITLDAKLFSRVKAVYDQRETMEPTDKRLVERYYARFVRAGALLDDAGKEELKKLNEEASKLGTQFTDNILKGRAASDIVVDSREQLDGLSEEEVTAAAEAAKAKGMEGKWLIALPQHDHPACSRIAEGSCAARAHLQSFHFTQCARRCLRQQGHHRPLAQLRAQKAKLLGFPNWAAYVMDDQMAKTPNNATKLLGGMAPAAARNAKAEAARLQALIDKQKGGFTLEPWDWDFYSEQVRKADYDLDEAEIKPYFELENVLQNGVFFAAHELYGLSFKERKDLPVYHPDVRVFDIVDGDGTAIGLFYGDYYARDNKNGGAWMDSYLDPCTLLDQPALITQNCNFVKPAPGQPCLLSYEDVTTLFHEFGHALHGMLSRQKYPYFAGTATTTRLRGVPLAVQRELGAGSAGVRALCEALQDRRAHAGGARGEDQELPEVQPGLRDHGVPGRRVARHRMAYAGCRCTARRRRGGLRAGRVEEVRP